MKNQMGIGSPELNQGDAYERNKKIVPDCICVNKRVIFRVSGRSISGRTQLQHEFAIDEIAGVESRREYTFNIWDLFIGILALIIGEALMGEIMGAIVGEKFRYMNSSVAGPII